MMTLLKFTFMVVFSAVWIWALFSAVVWETDFTKWHWVARLLYLMLFLYSINGIINNITKSKT